MRVQRHGFSLLFSDVLYWQLPCALVIFSFVIRFLPGLHVATSEQTFRYHDIFILSEHLSILLAGAGLAFMLELSEFFLVSLRSGLTLSIAGIVKVVHVILLMNTNQMRTFNVIHTG